MTDQSTQTIAQETAAAVTRNTSGEAKIYTMPEKYVGYLNKARGTGLSTAAKIGLAGEGGPKKGLIIGIIVGVLFLLALAAAAFFFIKSIEKQPVVEINTNINQSTTQPNNQNNQNNSGNQAEESTEAGICSDTNCAACNEEQCRTLVNKCLLENISIPNPNNPEELVTSQRCALMPSEPVPVTETPTTTPVNLEEGVILGMDTDNDGLTDEEEIKYGTDKNLADTDGDNYNDGLEILNSYSPFSGNSKKIIDDNLTTSFVDAKNGFSVDYPIFLEIKTDEEGGGVSFTATSTGQFFAISVLLNERGAQDIDEWFLQMNPMILPNDIKHAIISGLTAVAADDYSFYVLKNGNIYLLNYNLGYPPQELFKTSFQAFVRSFKLFNNPTE